MKGVIVVKDGFIYEEETHLTVLKTSHFFSGDGFTVYDSNGDVVFRVESYDDARDRIEIILMDASGRCLLTVRRKWASLHQRWEGFVGEKIHGQESIFNVRRTSIMGRSSLTVEVYCKREEYQIEGSFAQRSCTIFNASKESVAEIKRKVEASSHVMLGKDVFSVYLKPGFDAAFAMALVLILDKIYGDDYVDVDVDANDDDDEDDNADDDDHGGAEIDLPVDDSHASPSFTPTVSSVPK